MLNRKKSLTGFTLVELMIVVALIIMFSALVLPMGFSFFQEATLKDQVRNIENSLRKAQAMAMTGQGDSNVGVKITQSECIIFEGESYEKRREEADTIIPFPVTLSISGADEIVFQKSTGLLAFPPQEEASIIVTSGDSSKEITINSQGKIEIGQVVLVKENGTACSSDNECGSGYCVDEGGVGVCCNNACTGLCKTCSGDDGGPAGTCHNTNDGYDLDEECSTITNCGADGYCNGSGSCNTGIAADTSGTLNGDTVYCDEHNRLWTPTAVIDGSAKTYEWGGYGTDEPTDSCTDVDNRPACNYSDSLINAGYDDWKLPSCVSRTKNS